MFVLENLKKTLGKVTGVGKPSASSARRAVRRSKPHALMFKDDGSIPNNCRLPFLLYRGAVGLTGSADPAGLLEELFQANDGEIPGATAFTNMCITIRAPTKCSASPAGTRGCGSAATKAKSSRCGAGTS
jgi:hypothetical protein